MRTVFSFNSSRALPSFSAVRVGPSGPATSPAGSPEEVGWAEGEEFGVWLLVEGADEALAETAADGEIGATGAVDAVGRVETGCEGDAAEMAGGADAGLPPPT